MNNKLGPLDISPLSLFSAGEIPAYIACQRDFQTGAYDERQSDGSYGEDGKEKRCAEMDYKAHLAGYHLYSDGKTAWLVQMSEEEIVEFQAIHACNQIEQKLNLPTVATAYYRELLKTDQEDGTNESISAWVNRREMDEQAKMLGYEFEEDEDGYVKLVPLKKESKEEGARQAEQELRVQQTFPSQFSSEEAYEEWKEQND